MDDSDFFTHGFIADNNTGVSATERRYSIHTDSSGVLVALSLYVMVFFACCHEELMLSHSYSNILDLKYQ